MSTIMMITGDFLVVVVDGMIGVAFLRREAPFTFLGVSLRLMSLPIVRF